MTRRQLLGATAAGAARALAQGRRNAPKVRTTPSVCLYSQPLIKVKYDELGEVMKSLGVDGCDLSVFPGGHVGPENLNLDMMRSIEAITGVGLEVPVISTNYTNLADPSIRTVLGVCGEMGIPLFRAGTWKYTAGDIQTRLGEVQRDIFSLASIARAVNMTVVVRNTAGDFVGEATWDMNMIIGGLDPKAAGFDFDPGYATAEGGAGGWSVALRLALPRLKVLTARDFYWSKEGGSWKMAPCPLGEGMVDWPAVFATLARARFAGPISIQLDYQPKDNQLAAIRHDVEFVRKQIAGAYGIALG